MSANSNRLTVSHLPSFVDDDFLTKVADILNRLKVQSELGGHPLLASVLEIAKDEAEDDLRTRVGEFEKRGLLSEVDEVDRSVVLMAQRFAFRKRPADVRESAASSRLLSFPSFLSGGNSAS
jgi:hypothetical protein